MILTQEAKDFDRHFAESEAHTVGDALAGAGKSTRAIQAVTALPPEIRARTWFTTHSKHINAANVERLTPDVYAKGLHATGYGILHSLYRPSQSRPYMVEKKYEYILRDVLPAFQPDTKMHRAWSQASLQLWDLARNNLSDVSKPNELQAIASRHLIECPMTMAQASQILMELSTRGKREANYRVDFTDMLWLPIVLGLQPTRKFLHAVLDEAQDCTPLQEAFFVMASDGARCHILGDYNQAIYSFLGASGDAINRLYARLAATERGCKRLPLSVCWRCPTTHLDLAREIIPHIKNAPDAKPGVVMRTKKAKLLGENPPRAGDVMITRTNRPGVDMCHTLNANGIPSRMAGKDIGRYLVDMLRRVCKTDRDFQLCFSTTLDKYLAGKIARLAEEEGNEMAIASLIDRGESLRRHYHAADDQNVTTLANFEKSITDLYVDEDKPDHAFVHIATLHKFKGKEADRVYILNPEGIRHPKARTKVEIQQEINIDYIARTRSRSDLIYVSDGMEVQCVI